jgi:RNase P subunit RPR2
MKIKQEKLRAYLDRLKKANCCTLCGEQKWNASDEVFQMMGWRNHINSIVIYCENCGKMHFVNAKIAGLYDEQEENGDEVPAQVIPCP